MARIWTDGAEMGDTQFWDWINAQSPMFAVTTPTPVGGEWCYQGMWLGAYKLTPNLTEFYLRYRIRSSIAEAAGGMDGLGWRQDGVRVGGVTLDSITRISIRVGDSIVESSGYVMATNEWYLIEVHVLLDALVGRIEVYLDGEPLIDYTGSTLPGGLNYVNNIYWNNGPYTATYIDDLALNDTTGLVDNAWCGDGIITKMIPNGNGAHNDWTNSSGSKVNNYTYVDEFPNDGDLTYVYCDGTSTGTQEQYILSDLDYTNKTVLRIYPEARARKTAAGGIRIKLGILPNGGSDDVSAARVLYEDYYERIVGNEYLVNPVDSLDWEESDLDSLQVIAEVG